MKAHFKGPLLKKIDFFSLIPNSSNTNALGVVCQVGLPSHWNKPKKINQLSHLLSKTPNNENDND